MEILEVSTERLDFQYDPKEEKFIIIHQIDFKRKQKMRIRYADAILLKEWIEFAERKLMK